WTRRDKVQIADVKDWKVTDLPGWGDRRFWRPYHLEFSGDGNLLAIAIHSSDSKGGIIGNVALNWNQILLVEPKTWKVSGKITADGIPCTLPHFSTDGKLLAWGTTKAAAEVWDIARSRRLASLQGHDGPIRALTFTRDSKRLVTGSTDGTLLVWNVP